MCVIINNVLQVLYDFVRVFPAPSSLKKVPLSPVVKDRMSRFFYVADRSRASLLATENLMALRIIPLGDILARARAVVSIGAKKVDGASAFVQPISQQPEMRSWKRRHLIQVEDDPLVEEEVDGGGGRWEW